MSNEVIGAGLAEKMRVTVPLAEPEPGRAEHIARRLDLRLAELVAERETKRRMWRWVGPSLAAAGVALTVGAGFLFDRLPGSMRGRTEPFALVRGQVELAAADGASFNAGTAGAELELTSGAEVTLEPGSVFAVRQLTDGEEIVLPNGKVTLDVPKLGVQRLAVKTAEALVTVHGTRFSVEARAGSGTRVAVTEGRVEVRGQGEVAMLGAGDVWESPRVPAPVPVESTSPEVAAEPSAAAGEEEGAARKVVKRRAVHPQEGTEGLPTVASSLAEENRLYRAAARAKARSEFSTALAHFEQVLQKYPNSPLSHNAEVERFRVLQAMKQEAAAARAAREYLSRHADGFARSEARDLALGPAAPVEGTKRDEK